MKLYDEKGSFHTENQLHTYLKVKYVFGFTLCKINEKIQLSMNIGKCSDISSTLQEDWKIADLLISEG